MIKEAAVALGYNPDVPNTLSKITVTVKMSVVLENKVRKMPLFIAPRHQNCVKWEKTSGQSVWKTHFGPSKIGTVHRGVSV
jgi:hypothetical protein